MLSDPTWTEVDKRLFAVNRLRSAAQQALEQRYANPDSPTLADTLNSLIRDVHIAERAYHALATGGNA